MLVVGLTGGVGSGKSTVAGLLALHGAFLIDADRVAREVVAPKTLGLSQIEKRFGHEFISRSGELDRKSLAKLVFSDESALSDLNAIVHPLVRLNIAEQLENLRSEASVSIVVLMVPLLLESGQYPTNCVVVVDCPADLALERLIKTRGWSANEAQARMNAQMSREDRLAGADYVIDNKGDREHLERQVHESWDWITKRGQ